jgi:hypothetical protein
MEINRTYDVAGSAVREHEQRGLMLEATVPGCPVSMDLHSFVERFDDYFETAHVVVTTEGVSAGSVCGQAPNGKGR